MSSSTSAPGITASEVNQLIETNNAKMLATVYKRIEDSTEESRKVFQALAEESRKMHQALKDAAEESRRSNEESRKNNENATRAMYQALNSAEESRKGNETATKALMDVVDVVRGVVEASHGDRTDRNERTAVESRRRPQVDLFLSLRNKRQVIEIAKKHGWCRLTHTMKKEAMADVLVKDGVYELMVENEFVRAV